MHWQFLRHILQHFPIINSIRLKCLVLFVMSLIFIAWLKCLIALHSDNNYDCSVLVVFNLGVLPLWHCKLEISSKDIMATLSETVDAYTEKSAMKSAKEPCMSVTTVL